jgi:hypothetical protein
MPAAARQFAEKDAADAGFEPPLKHFSKLLPQACQARPAQLLNFHQYRVIHHRVFLSVTVNHSHSHALHRATSKCILQNVQTIKTPPGWTRRREGKAMIRLI